MDDMVSTNADLLKVAVVGMAGRFPGAQNVTEFWRNLVEGRNLIRRLDEAELKRLKVPAFRQKAPNFVPYAAAIEDKELFDAAFFGIAPREAEMLDPQQRHFLEVAWHALEDSGCVSQEEGKRTGVFASASVSSYLLFNLLRSRQFNLNEDAFQLMVGADKDFVASRASYKLSLQGPSFSIQSGCSSSLVAIHMAVQSLLTHQCDCALVGATSVGVPQLSGYHHEPHGIASADGACRPFDRAASGTVFGDGVAAIVLKRLDEALRDRNHIEAIILGSAVNNDGDAKVGYTAPSIGGQAEAILAAFDAANVHASDLSYIEAHGTATPLGDPIEIAALTRAFREFTQSKQFCGIGSVKGNVGHLDVTAGLAGFIKTVLMLKHRLLVPSINYVEGNPTLDLQSSPFYVVANGMKWESDKPRRAGVSSFGIGGTNAHVVLEEAPLEFSQSGPSYLTLFCISAASKTASKEMLVKLRKYLEQDASEGLRDVAYTLHLKRRHFRYRFSCIAKDRQHALQRLRECELEGDCVEASQGGQPQLYFMFPGGGSQHLRMGYEVYLRHRVYRDTFDRCSSIVERLLGCELNRLLFSSNDPEDSARKEMSRSAVALSALFATEYSMAQLLSSWGVNCTGMIGHSLGEFTAATLAGVFSLETALSIVAFRGGLLDRTEPGAMLSVGLSEAECLKHLGPGVSLAAVNGPELCSVSGSVEDVTALHLRLETSEISSRIISVNAAAHSSFVEPVMKDFEAFLAGVRFNTPHKPFMSNLSGKWITPEQATSRWYWVDHLRKTVRFSDSIDFALSEGTKIFVEVGPSNVLQRFVRSHLPGSDVVAHQTLSHPKSGFTDLESLYQTMGALWEAGMEIDWAAFYEGSIYRTVSLPAYAFQSERYWIEPDESFPAEVLEPPVKQSILSSMLYEMKWKLDQPRADSVQDNPGPSDGKYLQGIIFGRSPVDPAIRLALGKMGLSQIIEVDASRDILNQIENIDVFWEEGGSNPLVSAKTNGDGRKILIIHADLLPPTPPESFEDASRFWSTFEDLQALSLALQASRKTSHVRILLLASETEYVQSGDRVNPDKQAVIAACRIMPQENDGLALETADLDLVGKDGIVAGYEACHLRFGEASRIAVRKGEVFTPKFQNAELLDCAIDTTSSRIRGGVYVLVGGLGRLGRSLASYLTTHGARCLLITGRASESSLLGEKASGANADFLRSLMAKGPIVLYSSVDITESRELEKHLLALTQRFGKIDGVFHLAGVTGESTLRLGSDLTEQSYRLQCAPKAQGCRSIESALRMSKVDACILFSSTASILGGAGLSAYAAANAYLDSAAKTYEDRPTRWICINWDAWATEDDDSALESSTLAANAIGQSDALGITSILCAVGRGQYVISKKPFQQRFEAAHSLTKVAYEKVLEHKLRHRRPMLHVDFVPPRSSTEGAIADVWGEHLGIDPIGIDDNFFDLGGTSLLGLRVVSGMKRCGLDITITQLLEFPRIRDLCGFLSRPNSSSADLEEQARRGRERRNRTRGSKRLPVR